MIQEVPVPDLGLGESVEITLVTWLRQPGDSVAAGDILAEVLCEKANVEVEAPVSGVLEAVLVEEGAFVRVGQPIARIAVGAA